MKKIGVVGSRRRNDREDRRAIFTAIHLSFENGDIIVSGGCPKGADNFAEEFAEHYGCTITIHYPNWSRFGRIAGFERNTKIAKDAGILIACVAGDRKGGTEDTIKKFKKFHPNGEVILV